MEVQMRVAVPADEEQVLHLLKKTAERLKAIGSKQWNGILEGRDNHHTDRAIESGNVFVLEQDGTIGAMMILYGEKTEWDKKLWADQEELNAYYLHRLTVSEENRGRNISSACLKWAIEYTSRQGKSALRLDCLNKVNYLNELYRNAGFSFLKTIENYNAKEQIADFNLYEYRV